MPAEQQDTPHYWAIIDALPVAVLIKDTAKPQIYANQQARLLLSLPEPVLNLSDIRLIELIEPDSEELLSLVQNPLLLALSGSVVHQQVRLAGSKQRLQLSSQLVQLSFTLSNSVLVALTPEQGKGVIRDNQRSVYDENELEEALAFDKLMSLISAELINVQPEQLDIHIEDALSALGEFCHADRSYVFLFSDDMQTMSNTHEWVRDGIASHKANLQQVPEAALPYFWRVMQSDFIFAVRDVTLLPDEASAEQQEFEREDIQSVLCSAMTNQNKLLGFVGCDMVARKRAWTASDIRRLKLVGNMIGNTIQNVNYRLSLKQMQQELMQANLELQELASRDGLTGIANRRQFDTLLQHELQRCARYQLPLGFMLADIDHFKQYNDSYGHLAGDDALKQVARTLSQTLKRQGELVARFGGEEFAILVPVSNADELTQLAETLRTSIEQLQQEHLFSAAQRLTISIGATLVNPDKTTNPSELIRQADTALYQAKATGRNCFCIFQPDNLPG